MNTRAMFVVACTILGIGCKNNIEPPQDNTWAFPASSKFSVTLYADKSTISVGQTTDVKVILYNVSGVFGAAAEIRFPPDSLNVTQVAFSPNIFPASANALTISNVDSLQGKVGYGITLRAGNTSTFAGSAVICKVTVRSTKSGQMTIRLTPGMLALVNASGQPISNFSAMALENVTLTVQ